MDLSRAFRRVTGSMQTVIPIALLIFQLGAIIYARFVPTRYFCWAPFDTQTDYVATSIVNGHQLTAAEFQKRYRRTERGFDNRSPQHVIDMLEQVEQKRAALGDHARIFMKYRVNGKELREWRWPQASSQHSETVHSSASTRE
jgi:hypothetical protein